MDILGAIDSNFCSIDTPSTQQVIGVACKLDRLPDKNAVLLALTQSVARFPRLQKKIVKGLRHVLEEDLQFTINNHFIFDGFTGASTFEQKVSNYFSFPLESVIPSWRLVIFSYGEHSANPQAGMVLLVHHALADGLGVLRVFLNIVGGEDAFPVVPAAKVFATQAGDSNRFSPIARSLRQIIHEYFVTPKRIALNGKNSNAREIITAQISLDIFSKFAKESGGSLNDLFLAVVSEVVARYQSRFGLSCGVTRAIMPINLRTNIDTDLGNNLTGVGVMLPAEVNLLSERVSLVRQSVRGIKESGAIGAYYLLAHLTAYLPGVLQRLACEAAARRTNFICTNVPGPVRRMKLGGAEVLEYYGLPALMKEHGAAFCFFTSERNAFFSIVLDPAIVKDKMVLTQALYDSLAMCGGEK